MKTTLTVLLVINLYGLNSCATKQHYFINLEKSWDDAHFYCRTYYHNLSTFTDEIEEEQFLEDAVNQTSDAWIGLYKEAGIWTWKTGEIATPITWDDVVQGSDECAYLDEDDMNLQSDDCTSTTHSFFCMIIFEPVMIQQSESWEGALEYCRDHYDDLASLNSSRRMDYAVSKISAAQTQYVWIGLRFLAGGWFWISGVDVQYQAWSSTAQPQCPAPNQRCAALDKKTYTWTNRDCEEKLNFLCFPRRSTSLRDIPDLDSESDQVSSLYGAQDNTFV